MAHGDCISAIAEIAKRCGLKCPGDLSEIRRQVEQGRCGSLTTARSILEHTIPHLAEELYERLVDACERYKKETGKKHCCGVNLGTSVIDCSGMAPIVMDLLLQLVETHSHDQTVEPADGRKM